MSKKLFTILIIVVVFLGTVAFFAIINRNTVPTPTTLIEEDSDAFFPFDSITQRPDNGNAEIPTNTIGTDSSDNTQTNGDDNEQDFTVVDSGFSQIFEKPVVGFLGFIQEVEEIVAPPTVDVSLLTETYNFLDAPTMFLGSIGPDVQNLKIVLNRQGLDTEVAVTDVFDVTTKTAVIEFQNKNGMDGDGIVGTGTKKKLNEVQQISTNPIDFIPETRIVKYLKVRLQEKSNGHIHEYDNKTDSLKKITNTTIQGLHESFFGKRGNSIVARYLSGETIRTFVGDIVVDDEETFETGDSTNNSVGIVEGEFLVDDIPFVANIPGSDFFVYQTEDSFAMQAFVYNFTTGGASKIVSSRFKEWLPELVNKNQIVLTSRPSYYTEGYSYRYDNTDGFENIPERLVGGFKGLTTNISPDGTRVLYSRTTSDGDIQTIVHTIATKSDRVLGIKTLAEKCTWVETITIYCGVPKAIVKGQYPDTWYKGEVLFNDSLWKINTGTGSQEILLDPEQQAKQRFDITNIEVVEGLVLFQNKQDLTLWKFDTNKE